MKTVKEVSAIAGVSVRTLHHYDAIGLLKPTRVTEAGYRLYDESALGRLQCILLFRKLQFSLKDIRAILDSPHFDAREALTQQIRLLEMQREHLDALIRHARQIQKEGVNSMDFSAFDTARQDSYAAEAKKRWGHTEAYREFSEKTNDQSPEKTHADADALMAIFAELGKLRSRSPAEPEVQALIGTLQRFITDHYYTCTPQILRGLGQLYIAGDSMTENIDRSGGAGTAEFVHKAIEIYCK